MDNFRGDKSSEHCKHGNRPDYFQQKRLRVPSVAYCVTYVAVYSRTPSYQSLVPEGFDYNGDLWILYPYLFLYRFDYNFVRPRPT
jgi:hypothetical protein